MNISKTAFVLVAVAAAICTAPATAKTMAAVPSCTADETVTAQATLSQQLVESSCPELKFDASGAAVLSDTTFCQNAKCMKAIKKVRKALPACKLNDANVRAPFTKMVKACGTDGGDDGAAPSPATVSPGGAPPSTTETPQKDQSTKTPRPSKTPKQATETPSEGQPTKTPRPSKTPRASKTPRPSKTSRPSKTPRPGKDTSTIYTIADGSRSGSTEHASISSPSTPSSPSPGKTTKPPSALFPELLGVSIDSSGRDSGVSEDEEGEQDDGSNTDTTESHSSHSGSRLGKKPTSSSSALLATTTGPAASRPAASTTTKSSTMHAATRITGAATIGGTILWALLV